MSNTYGSGSGRPGYRSGAGSAAGRGYRARVTVPTASDQGARTPGNEYGGGGGGNYGGGGKTYGGGGGRPGQGGANWGRIGIVAGLVVSVLAMFGGLGVWAYANSLDDDLDKSIALDDLENRPENTDGMNFLVLGSDSRNPDTTEGSRADTIMLMHVPSGNKEAYIISLPRDLWVSVPEMNGNGGTDAKLNAATAWGGIPLMVATVEEYSGVFIDHVIEIDFAGLEQVVDALGGVELYVEETIQSIHGDKRTFEEGLNHMNGEEALDYVRQRYQFADGDFTRMRNQQALLMAMMDKAVSRDVLSSPSSVDSFLRSTIDALRVDGDFDLIDTALSLYQLRSDNLTFMTSPTAGTDNIDGQSVVVEDAELADSMYAAIRDDKMGDWVAGHPDSVNDQSQ